MLIEKNLFGTVDKVTDAISLLRKHEPPEGYYLCFTSGDDIFNWWINRRKGRYVVWGGKCQLPLFADDDNNIV